MPGYQHNIFATILVLACISLLSKTQAHGMEHVLEGQTMGTYYRVVLAGADPDQAKHAEKKVREVLERTSQSMSVFVSDSEISMFNQLQAGKAFCPSEDFLEVMIISFQAHKMTGGMFDPTLGPAIDLWGFGSEITRKTVPSELEISEKLDQVGLDSILMDENGCLTKTNAHTKLNLSGVAKGYGVDAVARALRNIGISSFLVDIGGDLYAADRKPDGTLWNVGISRPFPRAGENSLIHVLQIENRAVATSGNYSNYKLLNGIKFSHILDPDTGRPVCGKTAGATVTASSCALADALSTAMMVMDMDNSLQLAEESGLFEVMLLRRQEDQGVSVFASPGFYRNSEQID